MPFLPAPPHDRLMDGLDSDASSCYSETPRAPKDSLGFDAISGDIAQLGERSVRNAEVGGSNPPVSTNYKKKSLIIGHYT